MLWCFSHHDMNIVADGCAVWCGVVAAKHTQELTLPQCHLQAIRERGGGAVAALWWWVAEVSPMAGADARAGGRAGAAGGCPHLLHVGHVAVRAGGQQGGARGGGWCSPAARRA